MAKSSVSDSVLAVIEPLLTPLSVELIDLEFAGPVLRVTVDKDGGVDLDLISRLTRLISRALDETDPIDSRYTLEVSSPGLERKLRTPAQYKRAVGAKVNIKTVAGTEGERRAQGVLATATDDGVTILIAGSSSLAERTLTYEQIAEGRTVFEWAASPKPSIKPAVAKAVSKAAPP